MGSEGEEGEIERGGGRGKGRGREGGRENKRRKGERERGGGEQ